MDGERRRSDASCLAVLVVLGIIVVVVAAVEVHSLDVVEVEALLAVRAALRDPDNILGDWKKSSSGDGLCRWRMVRCSGDGHVYGLMLAHQNLSGTLSPEIGKLSRLQYLYLQHNSISGPIPGTIDMLQELQRLDLSYNQFAGTIPGSLGGLKDLFFVKLSNNNLYGPIPDSLATSQSIFFLDLSYNNLSGIVPTFYARNVFLDGNPFIQYFNCEESCSSVGADPVVVPVEKETTQNEGLAISSETVILCIVSALVIAFFVAGIIAVVWQWHRRHQIFAEIDGNNISHVAYACKLIYNIELGK